MFETGTEFGPVSEFRCWTNKPPGLISNPPRLRLFSPPQAEALFVDEDILLNLVFIGSIGNLVLKVVTMEDEYKNKKNLTASLYKWFSFGLGETQQVKTKLRLAEKLLYSD